MDRTATWWAIGLTLAILVLYELVLLLAQRRNPERMARSAHAVLREEWFRSLSEHPGSEVLAVQTLRNALMSATMVASTAVLGLMGTVTLAAPSLLSGFGELAVETRQFTPRLASELVLLAMLFASLVSSAMAVRYYNHVGFIAGMPVGSPARTRWGGTGIAYARKAGLLYSWGLRHLVLVAPILAFILYPPAGPVAALVMVAVLYWLDRTAIRE